MRKVPFKDLRIGMRFFDITQNGDEFVKINWTHARRIRNNDVVEFRQGGAIYYKGRL